jgi:23S rRNA pseudouridine2605 synthase
MYLLKFLAKCGICSRRKAQDLIEQGLVSVNGSVVKEPFFQVSAGDAVIFDGKEIRKEELIYIILNKPRCFVTTCDDDLGRFSVMDLIKDATHARVYPVGRLDRLSTGLLLFTNDGILAQKLSHPSYEVQKTYRVLLDNPFSEKDREKMMTGFELEDGFIRPDACTVDKKDNMDVTVQLHSGRNRIVRRMFEFLGYDVKKLDRIAYATLSIKGLARGQWRFLTPQEVLSLSR